MDQRYIPIIIFGAVVVVIILTAIGCSLWARKHEKDKWKKKLKGQ